MLAGGEDTLPMALDGGGVTEAGPGRYSGSTLHAPHAHGMCPLSKHCPAWWYGAWLPDTYHAVRGQQGGGGRILGVDTHKHVPGGGGVGDHFGIGVAPWRVEW